MGYIKESLSAGETIHQMFNFHWFSKIPIVLWVLLAVPTFGITLLVAIYQWLDLRSTEQGVTSKRVILKKGILSRKSDEMKIGSIETVEIDQGILGRIFGYGTVKVTGRGISDLVFKNIDDPMAVKKAIEGIEAA